LRVTGQAILDLWLVLSQPRGRLVAALEAVGEDGALVARGRRIGARSLQHLDPWTNDRFVQTTAVPPPTGRPLRVQLRFEPADLVAPRGGRLVLRLGTAGVAENGLGDPTYELPGIPDPAAGTITVLHDCEHPSALRFLRPRTIPDRIDVAEIDQDRGTLGAGGRVTAPVDPGVPLAATPVCGRGPERLGIFGPEVEYPAVAKKRKKARAKRKVHGKAKARKHRKPRRKPAARRRR
jgi:hypothetical protein